MRSLKIQIKLYITQALFDYRKTRLHNSYHPESRKSRNELKICKYPQIHRRIPFTRNHSSKSYKFTYTRYIPGQTSFCLKICTRKDIQDILKLKHTKLKITKYKILEIKTNLQCQFFQLQIFLDIY